MSTDVTTGEQPAATPEPGGSAPLLEATGIWKIFGGLIAVKVASLPSGGTLKNNGVAVSAQKNGVLPVSFINKIAEGRPNDVPVAWLIVS